MILCRVRATPPGRAPAAIAVASRRVLVVDGLKPG
jgi:hypothetical protein